MFPAVLFLLTACSETGTPTEPTETEDLAALLNEAGAFEDFEETYEESETEEFEVMSGNDQYFCTRKTVNLTEGYSDYP